jgi:hypothetical protein
MNSFVLRFTFLSVACALALAGSPEPLSKVDVVALLAAGSRTDYLVNLARARGIRFAMDDQLNDLWVWREQMNPTDPIAGDQVDLRLWRSERQALRHPGKLCGSIEAWIIF